MSAEETKFTLKIGVIVSIVSALVIFVLTNLWLHQTDITILKTNQAMVLQTLGELKIVPSKLAEINVMLNNMDASLKDHRSFTQAQAKKEAGDRK